MFDSTVCSCVLWCAQSWTLRVEKVHKLRTVQRSMLRKILAARRAPNEDYFQYLCRVTSRAEIAAKAAGVRDCVETASRYKWGWAGHVARRPLETWVWQTTAWRDSVWQLAANEMGSSRLKRPSKRRWMKWENVLQRFCSSLGIHCWLSLAADRDGWADKADAFVKWSLSQQEPDD